MLALVVLAVAVTAIIVYFAWLNLRDFLREFEEQMIRELDGAQPRPKMPRRAKGTWEPANPTVSKPAAVPACRIPAQLLFVEQRGRRIMLDALTLEATEIDGHHVPAGTPLMLKTTRRDVDEAGVNSLSEWAHEMAVVELEILPTGRLRVAQGDASAVLDVEGAVGMP